MQPGVGMAAARSRWLSDGCGCLVSFASGGRRVRKQSVPGPERSAARSHPVGTDAETPINCRNRRIRCRGIRRLNLHQVVDVDPFGKAGRGPIDIG